jgi:hypothetical protein
MPLITIEAIRARAAAIKSGLWSLDSQGHKQVNGTQGATLSTFAILRIIYGDPSPQLAAFKERLKPGHGRWDKEPDQLDYRLAGEIELVLDAALADYESGLTGSARAQAKGEVLGDFVALARNSLDQNDDGADRVAAVLAAAALEETLKQLGAENGIDVYNRDVRGVIQKLKDGNVLTGAQPAVANGLTPFRDRAFHGQFDQIERGTTQSALAFVEGLLTSRLS